MDKYEIKFYKSAEILTCEGFSLQDTRLEKILVEAFEENTFAEVPEIEGTHDLKQYIKNNFGEKI